MWCLLTCLASSLATAGASKPLHLADGGGLHMAVGHGPALIA